MYIGTDLKQLIRHKLVSSPLRDVFLEVAAQVEALKAAQAGGVKTMPFVSTVLVDSAAMAFDQLMEDNAWEAARASVVKENATPFAGEPPAETAAIESSATARRRKWSA